MKQWKLCKTKEEKAKFRRQRREQYHNMTPNQRVKWDEHRKTSYLRWLDNLTPEEKQKYKDRQRNSWQKFCERLTPERKAEIKRKIRINSKKKYNSLPKTEIQKRSKKRKEHFKTLSPEEIERRKIIASEKASAKNLKRKIKIIDHYSHGTMHCMNPKCEVLGGSKNILSLCIDHINGGGSEEMRKLGIRGGAAFHSWIVRNNYPSGYQILCASCNTIKVTENKENTIRWRKKSLKEREDKGQIHGNVAEDRIGIH